MVGYGCSTNGPQNFIGIQNSFREKTTTNKFTKTQQIFRNRQLNRNDKRNAENDKQWSDPSLRSQKRVFIDHVSQEKIGWNKQANLQPKETKFICTCPSFQTSKSSTDTYNSKTKRLYDKNRYLASLLSFADSTNALQIPSFGLRRTNVRNDLPTFRVSKCSVCFCKNYKLAGALVQTGTQYKHGSLSGRFPDFSPKSKHLNRTSKVHNSQVKRTGMVDQQREVISGTAPMPGVLRNSLEHPGKSENALRHKNPTKRFIDPFVSTRKKVELVGCKDSIGKIKFCVIRSPSRKATLSMVTNRIKQAKQKHSSQKMPYDGQSPGRAAMVAEKFKEKYSNSSAQSNYIYHHRCSRHRLGCNSKQSKIKGTMGPISNRLALQPKGTLGSFRNLEKSGSNIGTNNGDMANGQSNSGCLHNKTGRHTIKKAARDRIRYFTSMRAVSMSPHCAVHTRVVQRISRQPLADQTPTGMAFKDNYYRSYFSSPRNPRDRPVCISPIRCGSPVRKRRRVGCRESIHKCVQSNLALQPRLGVPSTSPNTESSSSPGKVIGSISTSNPRMGQSILDSGNKDKVNQTTLVHTELSSPPSRSSNEPATASSTQPQFAGLDSTGWAKEISSWKIDEIELLQASWRASTLKTYRPAWQRWHKYATDNNIQVDDPQPTDLARFLCYLHQIVKLAPSTILLHKSVVATFSNPQKTSALSSHPVVAHTIKGILSKKPTEKRALSWKVNDLLSFLETYNFDEGSLFSVSRHTSILLLLASGRRIHDLTLLDIDTKHFEENEEGQLIFWPKFGSKTDRSSYRQSGWCISGHPNIRFNIIHWIKQLLTLSRIRRESTQLKNLFISTRGIAKQATRAVISGWIKTLFKEANITSSAGSIRAGVATHNWTEKMMDIDEVLKRGNWQSKNTFFNHYFREIQPAAPLSNNINLSSCFLPVD
jgi:hypothetical protein